ncbi:MAG: hypothetical protein OEY55_13100 [Acidimicrobiia bacterium]|nr:hypothetical protein [Acidimicrobiia bacterium]MDH5422734.1 hypothetical protein [Acidimicrobiia bacterium]MDH5503868.1 hypothetical protein [Acidimicrobiia bacterium]
MTSIQIRLRRVYAFTLAIGLVLALSACGSSSTATTQVVDTGSVSVDPATGTDGDGQSSTPSDSEVPSGESSPEGSLDSIPSLEPTVEIEFPDLVQPRRLALSPDGSHVAVVGGGPNTDFEPFLTIHDTTDGVQVGEVDFAGDAGPFVDRIFWTADNRIVGLDTVSFETRVVTWDGTTFEFIDAFVMDDFVCLDAIKGFDPVAGAIFAFQDFDGGSTLCRRDVDSDSVFEVQPIGDSRLDTLVLRPDLSELVGDYYDRDSDRTMLVRFDPETLALVDETVLDAGSLEGVGIDVELVRATNGDFILEPLGVVLPLNLKRPLFSPDGSLLWVASDDFELVIDVSTGQPIGRFELGRGVTTWSGDGSVIASPTFNNSVQIFRP